MLPAVSSSFYTAMRVLPAARRQAMFDIYAFCRAVGDIADSHAPTAARHASLEQWRHDIDACYGGNAPPHLLSLHQQIISFGLKCDDFHAVIDGMMMDVNTDIFAPHAITLERYCDRVASAVGRLPVRVFGMQGDDGIVLAHHLGRALQLTNILRDIDEDAAIGRVYLPREALLTASADLGTPAAITTHPAIPEVGTNLATQAQTHFQAAEAIMRRSPRQWVRAPRSCGLPSDPDETLGTRLGEATLSGESPHFAANRHPVALGIHLMDKQIDKQIHGIDAGLAAAHTGGIHRSNFDRTLNARIDNGNHLVSFWNLGTLVCVPPLGVRNQSTDLDQLNFPFFDLGSGALEHISEINNR
jgi:phytoene synthase